jgi:hypothetical protein
MLGLLVCSTDDHYIIAHYQVKTYSAGNPYYSGTLLPLLASRLTVSLIRVK